MTSLGQLARDKFFDNYVKYAITDTLPRDD